MTKLERKPRRNIQYKDMGMRLLTSCLYRVRRDFRHSNTGPNPANAVLHHDNLEFLEDVVPKTTSYSKVKDQAAATRAKLQGEKKASGGAAELPNGKKHKTNGHVNGVTSAQKILADDDPSAQLEMEMRQAQRSQDEDVDMTG